VGQEAEAAFLAALRLDFSIDRKARKAKKYTHREKVCIKMRRIMTKVLYYKPVKIRTEY
jgi:hypothetical protein